ncbi:MAG: signal peptidase II [Solirubrobacteraceae bacterium]
MHERDAPARVRAALRATGVLVLVIAVDQGTKHTLGTWIVPGQVRHVIPGVELVYERNSGIAFSLLQGAGPLLYLVSGAVVVTLAAVLMLRPRRGLLWLPVGMLIGGAVSNLIDRVALGSVIDFIKLPHWPAFNVADISITFGAVIMAVLIEFGGDADDDGQA